MCVAKPASAPRMHPPGVAQCRRGRSWLIAAPMDRNWRPMRAALGMPFGRKMATDAGSFLKQDVLSLVVGWFEGFRRCGVRAICICTQPGAPPGPRYLKEGLFGNAQSLASVAARNPRRHSFSLALTHQQISAKHQICRFKMGEDGEKVIGSTSPCHSQAY